MHIHKVCQYAVQCFTCIMLQEQEQLCNESTLVLVQQLLAVRYQVMIIPGLECDNVHCSGSWLALKMVPAY